MLSNTSREKTMTKTETDKREKSRIRNSPPTVCSIIKRIENSLEKWKSSQEEEGYQPVQNQ